MFTLLLALTTRGLMEEDFDVVAEYIHESIQLTQFICDKLEGGSKAPLKVSSCKSDCFLKFFVFRSSKTAYTTIQKCSNESRSSAIKFMLSPRLSQFLDTLRPKQSFINDSYCTSHSHFKTHDSIKTQFKNSQAKSNEIIFQK